MALKLTENQSIAVNDKSGTLLVAAAAGSGKTAILTQRIIEKLCNPESDTDISEYLIVTFTKSATSELRERLYKALSRKVRENPDNARARRQLSLIGLAKISTIHSFCLDIVKSNFEVLGLPSKLHMGEETEINVLLRNTLEEILAEKYEAQSENDLFLKAVEILSSAKNDENFIKSIITLYKRLRGISEPEKKFLSYIDKYREVEECDEFFRTKFGALIIRDLNTELSRILSELSALYNETAFDEVLSSTIGEAVNKDTLAVKDIINSTEKGYETALITASTFASAHSKQIRNYEDKELLKRIRDKRTAVSKKILKVIKKYLFATTDEIKLAATECREVLLEIYTLIQVLDKRFCEKKLEKGLLDYADLEQYTLQLLVEDTGEFTGTFKRTSLAESISRNYAEIYVDEYQDTNMVQDLIFRAVSSYDKEKNTETNRFLVGDVKQSIYRFRGAQPEIFSSYIKDFKNVREDTDNNSTTHKIYLSNNFRCSESVINTVNQVFDAVMKDYTEADRLIYSKAEENKVNAPCELVLINSGEQNEAPAENSPKGEKISDEAAYIAMRIKEMAYNPNYLRENGQQYKYSDFAILSRSANSLSHEYRRAFKKVGVPFTSDTPEDFFSMPEVLLVMCLLNCVDNPQRDIYTAGLMYSPLFDFTPDELCEIRKHGRKMSFYSCVEKYALENEGSPLCEKTQNFISKISSYRAMSRGTPTDVLIRHMYDDLSVPDIYRRKEAHRRKNIMKIYELSRSFEKTSFRGLSVFLEYLENLAAGKTEDRGDTSSDSVKFISIHRSKGLEYPVVFLSGALRQFNFADEKEPIVFSTTHGIGIKLRDTKDNRIVGSKRNFTSINTPFREAINSAERAQLIEEEKRLLYVAMTRARDRLIITAHTKDASSTIESAEIKYSANYENYEKQYLCYFDFIYDSLSGKQRKDLQSEKANTDADNYLVCYKVDFSASDALCAAQNKKKETTHPLDEEKLQKYKSLIEDAKSAPVYTSPLSKISAKISVSQLKKGLLDEEENAEMPLTLKKTPNFMLENTNADGAEKGTAAHVFMQFADYESLEKNGARAEAQRLLEKGFITRRMYEILEFDILDAFTASGLYKEIKKSTRLYRERRFNLRLPASEFTENKTSDFGDAFILVQGVSDLYFENGDGTLTLVDFKTDRVKKDGSEEILIQRHSAQLGYYKRAIQEITGKTVSKVYIYSFALGREILLDI